MSTAPTGRRRPSRAPLVILLVMLLVAAPTAALGGWTSIASVQVATSAATVPAPLNLRCETTGGGLLQRAARVSWDSPRAGLTYRVLVDDGKEIAEVDSHGETTLLLDRGLLSNLLVGLLQLLLGGGRAEVTVVAVHPSGWTSESATPVTVTGSLLGVYCA